MNSSRRYDAVHSKSELRYILVTCTPDWYYKSLCRTKLSYPSFCSVVLDAYIPSAFLTNRHTRLLMRLRSLTRALGNTACGRLHVPWGPADQRLPPYQRTARAGVALHNGSSNNLWHMLCDLTTFLHSASRYRLCSLDRSCRQCPIRINLTCRIPSTGDLAKRFLHLDYSNSGLIMTKDLQEPRERAVWYDTNKMLLLKKWAGWREASITVPPYSTYRTSFPECPMP